MSRLQFLDWSTINLDELRKLPRQVLPPTFRLQDDCGNGCAGDPPGFPTYFTRFVYTQHGNGPPRNWPGHELVILKDGVCYGVGLNKWKPDETWEQRYERRRELFVRLWNRPAIDHSRTVAWIRGAFKHHHHCYQDDSIKGSLSDKTVIFPVPNWKLEHFHDDKRFSDNWRKQERAAVRTKNAEIRKSARKVAKFDNHSATVIVRRYYPEFAPSKAEQAELLAAEYPQIGNWWETMAERPTPEACPGQYEMKHPTGGSWCQMCGYETEE